MRLKTQSKLHDPENGVEGNCTQAAIATLMGMELDDVPDFNTIHKDAPHSGYFWNHIRNWFAEQGYQFQMLGPDRIYEGLYLASGKSVRGVSHMVVMRDGELYHDPHPSRAGIIKIDHIWILVPIDPALLQLKPGLKVEGRERKFADY